MKSLKKLILPLILLTYMLIYVATSKSVPCDGDCEKTYRFDTTLTKNRPYIWYTGRCRSGIINDTLCVLVKDTTGIDWNLFADTACQIATQVGLIRQTVLILKPSAVVSTNDTLVKRQCP